MSKRRIVVYDRMTADGYFAGADGNLNWAVPDDKLEQSAMDSLPRADTILFGRVTYEQFEGFWPHAIDDPRTAKDPHVAGRQSPAIRAIGMWINEATKIVFSKTRKDVAWQNSRLLREIDPREIETMKQQPGKDIMVFGSGSIVSQLTKHGLVDEYQFVVNPVLLGSGRPLLGGVQKSVRLHLINLEKYASGNVLLRYAPKFE